MMEKIVMQCGVRLCRNYADLPFSLAGQEELASRCVQRVGSALGQGGTLLRLKEMGRDNACAMAESRRISPVLLGSPETSAVFMLEDNPALVALGGRDQMHIRCVLPGPRLQDAAEACFAVDDRLSRQGSFAFDAQRGYLTASPADTGTGMRATLLMHLPLLAEHDEMEKAREAASEAGLLLEMSGCVKNQDGSHLYALHNKGSLGRTEQETLSAVMAAGKEIAQMEMKLRRRGLEKNRTTLSDRVYRAWGVLTHAWLLEETEFAACWSSVRLGAAMGLLPCKLETLDALPEQACKAHLHLYSGENLTGEALAACRAERVRNLLREKSEN